MFSFSVVFFFSRYFSNHFRLFFGKNNKSGTRGDSQVCHWCSYHILTSSMKRHTAKWNLLVLNNKETNHSSFFFYIFQNLSALLENRPFPYFAYKMKLRKITPLSNFTLRASRGIKFYRKSTMELRSLQVTKKMLLKISHFFDIRAALWIDKLGCCQEYFKSWKNWRLENVLLCSTVKAIRLEFLIKGASVTVENWCPLCVVILKSVWHSIRDTL